MSSGVPGLTAAIMAGGKSSRMGSNKSFVQLQGKPIIEHVLSRVSDIQPLETILITNHPAEYAHLGLPMFQDVLPEKGSLGGIYTALHYSGQPYTLVIACDMPFVQPDLLRYMVEFTKGDQFDLIVPRVNGYPEGLHAIYSQRCMQPIRTRLDAGQLKVVGFYPDARVRYIEEAEYRQFDPHGLSFYNVNTPEELAEAQRLAGSA